MKRPIRYIIFAIIIVLFQVLVCKHVMLGGVADPYLDILIYPLLLFILPVNTPAAVVVLFGFLGGLGVDIFYNSPGVHASALVLTAFLRKLVLNALEPRTGYAVDESPLRVRPSNYWYYSYTAVLLFIHILVYNLVSFFSLAHVLDILIKTVLTFVVSMLLIGLHAVLWRTIKL